MDLVDKYLNEAKNDKLNSLIDLFKHVHNKKPNKGQMVLIEVAKRLEDVLKHLGLWQKDIEWGTK